MTDQAFHRVAKALADPRRFRMLQRVASAAGEVSCQTLLSEFRIAPATMSHHLKELETAGVIESRQEGQFKILSVDRNAIARYQQELTRRLATRG